MSIISTEATKVNVQFAVAMVAVVLMLMIVTSD